MSHSQKNTALNLPEGSTEKAEGLDEEWRDVADTDGQYQVSNLGRVRSNKWGRTTILRNNLVGCGYYRMSISTKIGVRYLYVHRMVMESFVGINPLKNVVNHKDGNKLNNRLENLEWVTQGENVRHSVVMHLSRGTTIKNPFRKLSDLDVLAIRASKEPTARLSERYKVKSAYINKIKRNLIRCSASQEVSPIKAVVPINESEWILCA